MKIMVLNSGSSSIKLQVFNMEKQQVIAKGLVERIGEKNGKITFSFQEKKYNEERKIEDHHVGLERAVKILVENGVIKGFNDFAGIGHRVVHGGEKFSKPVLINDEVVEEIESLISLAPLHNPANLDGIKVSLEKSPGTPNVAVFDTAFHQSIPDYAYLYAIPYEHYEKNGVRRYGFHGTSHHCVTKKAAEVLGKKEPNLITLHLGNGASVCAVKEGKSVDTSMGLTPLEGLVMGTRSGDLDPAIIPFLARKTGMTLDEIDTMLNKKSGLKGICGMNDMREIAEKAQNGDRQAALALEIFCYRIKKYIGSYIAVLERVDGIVFTGGIGEHAGVAREKICSGLEGLGIELDNNKNNNLKQEEISKEGSKVKVLVLPTNEELEIARGVVSVLERTKTV